MKIPTETSQSADDFFDHFQQQVQIRFLNINDCVQSCTDEVKSTVENIFAMLEPNNNKLVSNLPSKSTSDHVQIDTNDDIADQPVAQYQSKQQSDFEPQEQDISPSAYEVKQFPNIEPQTRSFRTHSIKRETKQNNPNAQDNIFQLRDHRLERQRILSINYNNVGTSASISSKYSQFGATAHIKNQSSIRGIDNEQSMNLTNKNPFALNNTTTQQENGVFRVTFKSSFMNGRTSQLHDRVTTSEAIGAKGSATDSQILRKQNTQKWPYIFSTDRDQKDIQTVQQNGYARNDIQNNGIVGFEQQFGNHIALRQTKKAYLNINKEQQNIQYYNHDLHPHQQAVKDQCFSESVSQNTLQKESTKTQLNAANVIVRQMGRTFRKVSNYAQQEQYHDSNKENKNINMFYQDGPKINEQQQVGLVEDKKNYDRFFSQEMREDSKIPIISKEEEINKNGLEMTNKTRNHRILQQSVLPPSLPITSRLENHQNIEGKVESSQKEIRIIRKRGKATSMEINEQPQQNKIKTDGVNEQDMYNITLLEGVKSGGLGSSNGFNGRMRTNTRTLLGNPKIFVNPSKQMR